MFWILAALLLAAGLALMLRALLRPPALPAGQTGGVNVAVYRDQLREAERDLAADLITPERYEQLRTEVQRRVLEDTQAGAAPTQARPARGLAWLLALGLPLASVATYLALGRPDIIPAAPPAMAATDGTPPDARQIEAMVTALARRLKTEPDNAEGWLMLARSYAVLGRLSDANAALGKAGTLKPDDANVLTEMADVLGEMQDRSLAGEPRRLLERALQADPRHVKALALAGGAAFQAGEFATARGYWNRLLAVVPADSEIAKVVHSSAAEAERLLAAASSGTTSAASGAASGAAPAVVTAAAPAGASSPAAAVAAGIRGEVQLSSGLASRVAAGDTVFIYARAAAGSRLPLAIVRQPVGSWPLRFQLDDSMAMSPQARLSGATAVIVTARVSRSGEAAPQSGDLIGESAPMPVRADGLRIVIDRIQP